MAINLYAPLVRPSRGQTGMIDDSGYVGSNQAASPQGFANLPGAFDDSGWPPKGGWQLGDFPNALGNLANWVLQQQGGLLPQTTSTFSNILNGQIPTLAQNAMQNSKDYAQQMSGQFNDQLTNYFNNQILNPMMAQNAAQIQQAGTQAQRQAGDQLQGGMRAQAISDANNNVIEQIAKSNTNLQTQLGGQLGMSALQNAQGLYRDAYNNSIAGLYNPLLLGTYQGALQAGQNVPNQIGNLLTSGGAQRVGAENAKTARKQGGGGMFK